MTKETRRIVGKWYKLGITHKSEFAKDVMGIFLKTDWPEKQNWSKEKLWTGGLAVFQRDDEEGVKGVLPVLAAFCLKKEEASAQECCAASNMVANKKGTMMNYLYRSLCGLMVEDKMGAAKFIFIRTVIHNSIIGGAFNKGDEKNQPLQWKPDPKYLWFTSPKERATR
eukprot:5201403-Ditylum_brightwellii.AAC.1